MDSYVIYLTQKILVLRRYSLNLLEETHCVHISDVHVLRIDHEYEDGRQSSISNRELEEKIALYSQGTLQRK